MFFAEGRRIQANKHGQRQGITSIPLASLGAIGCTESKVACTGRINDVTSSDSNHVAVVTQNGTLSVVNPTMGYECISF